MKIATIQSTYTVLADIGSIRINSPELSATINAGSGDGAYRVQIVTTDGYGPLAIDNQYWRFVGDFVVTGENVTLSRHDCKFDPIHTFAPGRYAVYHLRDEHSVIIAHA